MAGLEGNLVVDILRAKGRIAHVRIDGGRPIGAARILIARRPEHAVCTLPRLYALCGTAQACAGLMAVEQALDCVAPSAHAIAREMLVLAESVEEACRRILCDWPPLLGEAPAPARFKPVRAALSGFKALLYPQDDWTRIGGGALRVDLAALDRRLAAAAEIVVDAVLGLDEDGDILGDMDAFAVWRDCSPTPAARLLRWVDAKGLAGFGRSGVEPIEPAPESWIASRLAADADGGFCARPERDGKPVETGPFARLKDHPVLAALAAEYGNGLFVRLTARVIDAALGPSRLRALADFLPAASSAPAEPGRKTGVGVGSIENARGRLVHRVEIENDAIARWQVVAPTEWNFHPQGALAQGLAGAAEPEDVLTVAVPALVAALDPCVPCQVSFGSA